MKKRCYVTVHALQTMPASCVNRDDAGSPKDMLYGGIIRARVSSQAWKRAIKKYFEEMGEETGIRTKELMTVLVEALVESGVDAETAETIATSALKDAELVSDEKDKKSAMVYLSQVQIDSMLEVIKKKLNDGSAYVSKDYKFDLKKAISDNPTGDMLLFGRMMAKDPSLSYDASCQVAHAFSVNEVKEEYDYFTAVDEFMSARNHSGAGHIDSKSYNSGVYYRYANVNMSDTSELVRMDRPNAVRHMRNFLEAFVRSIPSGSCNSFANTTLPDVVVVELRNDAPVSYAPAFLDVVTGTNYMEKATEKMMNYAHEVDRKYGGPVLRLTLDTMSLNDMLDKVEEVVTGVL